MKKIIYTLALVCITSFFASCSDDEPNGNSIFDTTPPVRNEFDKWLLKNYATPYNVDFKYKMEDIESSISHDLAPADYNKSIAMAKLVKFLWIEAYDEVSGTQFTRTHIPRVLHLIGSPAYNAEGTEVLGTAEGGLKVTLYKVNALDVDNLDLDFLNLYFFKTMHHEFTHILTQKRNYDPEFQKISQSDYVSGNWYQYSMNEANEGGFLSPYSMNEYNEDFAENIAIYVTSTPAEWNAILIRAGAGGKPIILKKFAIVRKYLSEKWDIDIDHLRDVVQRRSSEIDNLDLVNL